MQHACSSARAAQHNEEPQLTASYDRRTPSRFALRAAWQQTEASLEVAQTTTAGDNATNTTTKSKQTKDHAGHHCTTHPTHPRPQVATPSNGSNTAHARGVTTSQTTPRRDHPTLAPLCLSVPSRTHRRLLGAEPWRWRRVWHQRWPTCLLGRLSRMRKGNQSEGGVWWWWWWWWLKFPPPPVGLVLGRSVSVGQGRHTGVRRRGGRVWFAAELGQTASGCVQTSTSLL